MTIFFIASTGNDEKISQIIEKKFDDDSYKLTTNQWLVSTSGTTKEIYAILDPTEDGSVGSHIVIKFESYYGWHDAALWEWLKVKKDE